MLDALARALDAAVRGPYLAGGCELALACDITIAGDGAIFGEPKLRLGAGIVVMILPWLVSSQARRLWVSRSLLRREAQP
jgi:enoyl-CoA hydratase/carnithine racemase